MAGDARLRVSPPLRFAAVVALVVGAHSLALRWLGDALSDPSAIVKPMAAPMFTRVLEQQVQAAAPTPAATARTVAPRKRTAVAAVQAKPPPPPEPVPPPEVTPPQPAASAPVEIAAATPPAAAASAASAPAAPATASLDTWPADTRLNYRLSGWYRGELYGSARVQWQRQEERYQSRVEIDVTPFVSIALTSQGVVGAEGLMPAVYEELRRSGPRTVRVVEAELVLNDGRRVSKPANVQDTASQFVELSHRFSTGQEKLEVGRAVQVWLARPGGVDLWTYDIVEREMLPHAKLGAIEAFHLKPRPIANPRGNIVAEMWFAPRLQYLPVRIKVTMGEDTWVDLMVETIQQR